MRLLHTSDWHLGARLGRQDRQRDHVDALRGLIDVAERSHPDLILHTGDVFDAPRPPYDALRIGVKALLRLARIAPTVVISGNHDSPQLLRVIDDLAGMADDRRLWMVTGEQVVTVPGLDDVAIACVPFVPLTAVADLAEGDPSAFEGTYADGIRHVNERLLQEATERAGRRGVVLYAAHLHLHGARPGRSERRITVGEDYAAHVGALHRAMYAALGHIHDPQLLPGGTVTGRYAGSLIPIDFGEAVQRKVALVVTIRDGDVTVDEHPLPGGRPLTEFSGTVAELDARAADGGLNGHILKACVTSDEPVLDLAERVVSASPDCAIFDLVNAVTNAPVRPVDMSGDTDGEPGMRELFAEWRATAARGATARHEDVTRLFSRALEGEHGSVLDGDLRDVVAAAESALADLNLASGMGATDFPTGVRARDER